MRAVLGTVGHVILTREMGARPEVKVADGEAHPGTTEKIMGTEAQEGQGSTTQATVTNGAPAAQQAAPAAPPPPAPVQQSAPVAQSVERVPTRKLIEDNDDEIPRDAELLEMSPVAFKKRLERSKRSELKSLFGTDNVEEIQKIRSEYAELKKAHEDKRLADMSEVERLKEQLARTEEARSKFEQHVQQMEQDRVIAAADQKVMGMATRHIHPRYMRQEVERLKYFIRGLSEEEMKDEDAVLEEWFKSFIAEVPWMAKDYAPPAPEVPPPPAPPPPVAQVGQVPAVQRPPPVQVPMTNGGADRPAQAQAAVSWEKTPAPGKPNSMTDGEWMSYKRVHGISY